MTWKPTNELRKVRRKIMRCYPTGYQYELGGTYTWGPSVEDTHLVLQQKWRWAHGTDVYMAVQEEWRDVPEVDETPPPEPTP